MEKNRAPLSTTNSLPSAHGTAKAKGKGSRICRDVEHQTRSAVRQVCERPRRASDRAGLPADDLIDDLAFDGLTALERQHLAKRVARSVFVS
eukprot:COSAG01_NODE_334_length_18708_cov_49.649686_8_plen_92_part_00